MDSVDRGIERQFENFSVPITRETRRSPELIQKITQQARAYLPEPSENPIIGRERGYSVAQADGPWKETSKKINQMVIQPPDNKRDDSENVTILNDDIKL